MLADLEKLLALQDRDSRIRAIRLELAALPDERARLERQIQEAKDELEASRKHLKEAELERKRLEGEVAAKRNNISRYRQQQLQTRKNEEYQALANEIALTETEISVIEDAELTAMEEAEKLVPRVADAEAHANAEQERLKRLLEALSEKKTNLEVRLEEFQTSRSTFLEGIPEDLLALYQRLFQNKAGTAIVPLEHEVCTGCHMKVPVQIALEVKGNKHITHCSNCGRILFAAS